MTKIEKSIIAEALSEYVNCHRNDEPKYAVAMGLLHEWLKIMDEPCGTCRI